MYACELRTLRKFEDITYEPSREEAAPYPYPSLGQDRTGQLFSNMLACLSACLSTYPSRKGRGPFRMHKVGEIQVQSYRGTEIQVEGGKP